RGRERRALAVERASTRAPPALTRPVGAISQRKLSERPYADAGEAPLPPWPHLPGSRGAHYARAAPSRRGAPGRTAALRASGRPEPKTADPSLGPWSVGAERARVATPGSPRPLAAPGPAPAPRPPDPWARHQRHEARQHLCGREHQMRRPVRPRPLQRHGDPSVAQPLQGVAARAA